MTKKIDVGVFHEMEDESVVEAIGKLDLDTGAISDLEYSETQVAAPHKRKDYSFSYGLLKLNGKELEFTLEAQKNNTFKVPTGEFSEMKEKAIALLSAKVKPKF